ncbi:hypothetical protein SSS_03494 [Sarcoptes scabiei]|uniref:RCC1 and BTB domain-containing protein 2 n=1 Tax=Sarcoptes scabiei TaxID=52283 RepID=A0A132AGI3_SARSC|nr:hypothetical protein SSS_03494 [Sarcoptes scabiei]KPM10116.1 RCC1-like protein [Sarcoptes scabiei]
MSKNTKNSNPKQTENEPKVKYEKISTIEDIALHPLLREVALVDPNLFQRIDRVYFFDFPLTNSLMMFTKDNRAYVYGENNHEALGFKLTKKGNKILHKIVRPRELDLLREKNIVHITYRRHIMLLSDDGLLYGWGSNDYGPLGISKARDFCIRPSLLNTQIQMVDSHYHTLFVSFHNRVFVCGLNVDRQVNPLLSDDVVNYPIPLDHITEHVRYLCCSSRLSLVLAERNIIYLWGSIKETVVNIHQKLEEGSKIKKIIILEYLNGDAALLSLNYRHQMHVYKLNHHSGKLVGKLLFIHEPASDIYSSDHSSFFVVCESGKVIIYKSLDDEGEIRFEVIVTNTKSIVDASRLYRIRLRKHSLNLVNDELKNHSFILSLRSFLNASDTDFAFGWDASLLMPKLTVKKSVLVQHCSSFHDFLQFNEYIWPLKKEKENLLPDKRYFRYRKCYYPSYEAMYGYLRYAYTGKILFRSGHLSELKKLAEFFRDGKLIEEIRKYRHNSIKIHIVPKKPDKFKHLQMSSSISKVKKNKSLKLKESKVLKSSKELKSSRASNESKSKLTKDIKQSKSLKESKPSQSLKETKLFKPSREAKQLKPTKESLQSTSLLKQMNQKNLLIQKKKCKPSNESKKVIPKKRVSLKQK